jgi:predicted PurR-regulated permease PerM
VSESTPAAPVPADASGAPMPGQVAPEAHPGSLGPGRPLSPRWTASAKLLAGLTIIGLALALLVRFSGLLQLVIVAGILSFLMVPVVRLLHQRVHLSWRTATHLTFLVLAVFVVLIFAAASLGVAQQLQSLVATVQLALRDLPNLLQSWSGQVIVVGPFRFDLSQLDLASLADQAVVYIRPFVGQASGWVTALAGGAIESIARTLFVFAAAYYLTLDQPMITPMWRRASFPGFDYDWRRLREGLDRIWTAFLRGQIVLGGVIALVVTLGLSLLGVRNPLVLGLVSGLLEFIPIVGPVVAGAIAAMVAFFQGSNWWGLSSVTFTLIVIVFFIVVQQLENNLLVPRILGRALKLNPVVVLIAAVIGASLAGVLGILLSAPTMATLVFLGRYVYRKVFDLPPWDPPIDGIVEDEPSPSGKPGSQDLSTLDSP